MWSIYDTCILVSGVIIAAIAVVPVSGIGFRNRGGALVVGGLLIAVSLILGNLPFFRYPAIVVVLPFIALFVMGAVIWDARRPAGKDAGLQASETASHAADSPAIAVAPQGRSASDSLAPVVNAYQAPLQIKAQPQPVVEPALAAVPDNQVEPDGRIQAWAEVHDAGTTSERLAEIAALHPEFAPAICEHPNCYPALTQWAMDNGLLRDGDQLRP